MLKKCFKHEWIALSRMFLPIMGLLVILTPVLGLLFRLGNSDSANNNVIFNIMFILSIIGYVLLMIAAGVASFVLIILRFYRSTTTDEAYLTFTLPAKVSTIIWSKLLVAFIWELISTLMILLSIAAFTYINGAWNFGNVSDILASISDFFTKIDSSFDQGRLVILIIAYVVYLAITTVFGTLMFYAAIALGQLMNSHRVLASIGFYMALYTVNQIVTTVAMIPFFFSDKFVNSGFEITAKSGQISASLNDVINTQFKFVGAMSLVAILFGAGCYLITVLMYKKKLNLE